MEGYLQELLFLRRCVDAMSCHNASKTADKVVYQPTSTALPSWITTTPPKQTSSLSFNDSITNLEARSREVNGDTQLIIPRPVKPRPRKPSRNVRRGGHVDIRSCSKEGFKAGTPSHPIRARESNHPPQQSERANQRASIAKSLPPLHSHTTPSNDGPVSDSAAQRRASSTRLSAAAST